VKLAFRTTGTVEEVVAQVRVAASDAAGSDIIDQELGEAVARAVQAFVARTRDALPGGAAVAALRASVSVNLDLSVAVS
jgi:hypothetical protein